MSAWLLLRPARPDERQPRYLAGIDAPDALARQTVRTTPQPVLALRFRCAADARAYAQRYSPHFDEWRIVRR
jgi:hypothetical protein